MSASRGYDCLDYVVAYRDQSLFPAIHDDIFGMVAVCSTEKRFLDLGCSTGLLGQRLLAAGFAEHVVGVDIDKRAMDAGAEAGVRIQFEELAVRHDTLARLGDLISRHRLRAVLARRCFPEILGRVPDLDAMLAAAFADAGIVEIFVEGRIVSTRASNRLLSLDREVKAMSSRFRLAYQRGRCAQLVTRTDSADPAVRSSPS